MIRFQSVDRVWRLHERDTSSHGHVSALYIRVLFRSREPVETSLSFGLGYWLRKTGPSYFVLTVPRPASPLAVLVSGEFLTDTCDERQFLNSLWRSIYGPEHAIATRYNTTVYRIT
jgi:hypothetical protein